MFRLITCFCAKDCQKNTFSGDRFCQTVFGTPLLENRFWKTVFVIAELINYTPKKEMAHE